MLTDEIAQVHRSPGFITSNLIGKREDGIMIKEYEASHGTVADLWEAHLLGKETSMNPLGMMEALMGAMNHSADLLVQQNPNSAEAKSTAKATREFTELMRKALHNTFRYGQGTRDMAGPEGLTTEKFIDKVAWRLGRYIAELYDDVKPGDIMIPARSHRRNYNVDKSALRALFNDFDTNKDGAITVEELEALLVKLGVAPLVDVTKRGSASNDRAPSVEQAKAATEV
eukprot:gene14513-16958_t